MEKSLEQAAENPRPGLEDLAKKLQEAAENLKNGKQDAAQQGLNGAAQQLEELEQRIESQDLKNQASKDLQNLKDSLQQRGAQQSAQKGGGKGQQQQDGKSQPGQGQGQKPQPGQANQSAQGQPQDSGEGEPTDQAGENGQTGAPVAGGKDGNGLMPGGPGGTDLPREGAPTKLDVKLQQEKVEGQGDGGEKPENLEETSKQERSRLDYRNVKSDLSPAQKDLLNQDRIPWEYRPLIKDYFQAIRPAANTKK
jgi:Ca-activated chloride channel homolog